jgi:hypothetical protein
VRQRPGDRAKHQPEAAEPGDDDRHQPEPLERVETEIPRAFGKVENGDGVAHGEIRRTGTEVLHLDGLALRQPEAHHRRIHVAVAHDVGDHAIGPLAVEHVA